MNSVCVAVSGKTVFSGDSVRVWTREGGGEGEVTDMDKGIIIQGMSWECR